MYYQTNPRRKPKYMCNHDNFQTFRRLDVHKTIASYVFCCKQLKLQQRDTCMDVQNPPKSDFGW